MIKPTPEQLKWQQAEFGMLLAFGINTFYGKEWSDGTLSPDAFDPAQLDARQWVDTAQQAGMRYMILTAKHHDGFCLWPTATTDYSVASSPWKQGNGDVIREFTEACAEVDMPCGLYLSPWDRHEPCYPDAEAYNDFYCRQMEELCTQYGPLFEIWLDGAGSEGRVYDWDAIMAVTSTHQPDAMIFNMGRPTIRWAGNEDGLAEDPTYYVVDETAVSAFAKEGQTQREKTARYIPPECDVAIRQNWFWQPDDLSTLKTKEHLLGIYYRSIGLGANLLLNVPPDRRGLISDEDRTRLLEMTNELKLRFQQPLPARLREEANATIADFGEDVTFDHLCLEEPIENGQHIDGFEVQQADAGTTIAKGHTVGHKRLLVFPKTSARAIRIVSPKGAPKLQRVTAYLTGHETLPTLGATLDYQAWAAKADEAWHKQYGAQEGEP